jgi:magnesium-transporting ATPase (P-type)
VSKGTDPVEGTDTPLGDRTDMVYMNTNVTRGSGEFVVTATGMATEVGHISGMLRAEKGAKTPLTRQLDKLTRQIFFIAGLALAVSVVISLARGDTFTAVFNAAVAFAIGALPENLPAVVTTILAYGTQALAKIGAIMKRLQSTETLGSTAAINSDKTGTLTLNQMTAVQMAVVGRRYAIEGRGYSAEGHITHVGGQREIPLDEFLLPMVLASDAVLVHGELIGDPTEGALVALAAKGGIDAVSTRQEYPRVAELPFDATYKLMATFHKMTDESGKKVVRCFVKGAPDQLLARSATVYDADAGPVPAEAGFRELYLAENRRLGGQGLRVMATARKDFDPAAFDPAADLLPLVDDLELLALVGIVDPPRPTAKASIATAKAAGIRVRMITDDDFSTIVKAVELGRGLYDNLVKYIRFQMGALFGFIISFLGAAGGAPDDHQPRRPAMAYLHRRRTAGHRCVGDPQGGTTAGGRPNRALTSSAGELRAWRHAVHDYRKRLAVGARGQRAQPRRDAVRHDDRRSDVIRGPGQVRRGGRELHRHLEQLPVLRERHAGRRERGAAWPVAGQPRYRRRDRHRDKSRGTAYCADIQFRRPAGRSVTCGDP